MVGGDGLLRFGPLLDLVESNFGFVVSIFSLVTSFPGSPLAVTKNKNWGSGLGFRRSEGRTRGQRSYSSVHSLYTSDSH